MVNFMTLRIADDKCVRCLKCISACPTEALEYYRGCFMHNAYACNYEYECMDACPNDAIKILDM